MTTDLRHKAGRNNSGKITVRHQGGGARRKYRIIDFRRNKDNIPAKVAAIEYDPNRTCFIALLNYADGEKRYILAPLDLKVGDTVMSGAESDIKPGNCLPHRQHPAGHPDPQHRAQARPRRPDGSLRRHCRSADGQGRRLRSGSSALSGEVRKVPMNCRATIGTVGNTDHENVRIGKAGRKRHMGIRPTVRGVVMNPCDHPHGGGEGRSPVGMPAPMSPWGKPTQGVKTRKHRKYSDKMIVKKAGK